MTQGFDEYWDKENVRFEDSYHKHKETYDLGAASRQGEIDKIKSDNQLFESQIGQVCVKWKEVAEKRQAEIDELQKRIDKAMSYVSESPLKDVSRRAMLNFLDILKGESNE